MSEQLLKAGEVASMLCMSTAWVLDKWEAGELPGFRLGARKGGPVRFRKSEILEWLEQGRRGPEIGPRPEALP